MERKTLYVIGVEGGYYMKVEEGYSTSKDSKVKITIASENIFTDKEKLFEKIREFFEDKEPR
ncbi:hypothetical protein LCGC14_1126380 [marine sediment metagenome]|uniref:Uncharacterized protein n=1 Tax=marine sediment metagenome TaxID=412755 RepID=A0A0F9M2G0_9ZZZZ